MLYTILFIKPLFIDFGSAIVPITIAIIGVIGNWYLVIQNKKKEIEQKEYQFLLENLKGFWEYQNKLYTETLKVVSVLVLNKDIKSEKFLSSYKRFWELYWGELPTCESNEIESALVGIKKLVYQKKNLKEEEGHKLEEMEELMNEALLNLAKAIKKSSLLLEYSEKLREKIKKRN